MLEFQVLEDVCLLRSETVIIHGTSLTSADLDDAAAAGAKLIIAPTSNYLYYGATADVVGPHTYVIDDPQACRMASL